MDTRLVRDGYVKRCSSAALAFYLFLVVVGDAEGLSYYSDDSIAKFLSLPGPELTAARRNLLEVGLIAYQAPLYQVLSLELPVAPLGRRSSSLEPVREILREVLRR